MEFIEALEPEVYIHPELRGKNERTYTDAQGMVQGFERTKEGYEALVTNPRLAAEKKHGNIQQSIS